MAEITPGDIRGAIRALGLSGQPLCVHSSLSSMWHVEGGADAVLDALLAEGCTVLVPAFVYDNQVAPPPGANYERNGGARDNAHMVAHGSSGYAAARNTIDPSMGAIPRQLLHRHERVRGDHPLNSFAALGPLAAKLIGGQTPLDVYAPLRALADAGGWVLLIGVGLTCMTLLHEAERVAGRELFRRWAVSGGEVVEAEVGSCSSGFESLGATLAPLRRSVTVGQSLWQAFPAAETIKVAAEAIEREPSITHCDDPACERCNDAVAGGPLLG